MPGYLKAFVSAALTLLIMYLPSIAWAQQGKVKGGGASDQNAPSVLILANSPSEPAKLAKLQKLAGIRGFSADIQFISGQDAQVLGQRMQEYDVIVLDYVYAGQFDALINVYEPYLKSHPGIVFAGIYFSRGDLAKGLTAEQSATLFDYYSNGGEKNFSNFFQYIKHHLLNLSSTPPEPPIILPETGIYHPYAKKVFSSLDEFIVWRKPRPEQPLVGIGFMRKSLEEELTVPIDALVERLEAAGIVAVPYFHPTDKPSTRVLYRTISNKSPLARPDTSAANNKAPYSIRQGSEQKGRDKTSKLDGRSGATPKATVEVPSTSEVGVDLLVTFRGVMSSPSLRHHELETMDIVAINAMVDGTQNYQQWLADEQGWPMFRMGPWWTNAELAGYIDPVVVGAKGENEAPDIIPEQMDALVERIQNYLKLKHKPNAGKKVAFLVWNSPAGEDNFSASYLNVPESLIDVFAAMRKAGYHIDEIGQEALIASMKKMIKPYYRSKDETALRQLLAENLAIKVPLADYTSWYKQLPESIRQEMAQHWPDIANNYLTIEEQGDVFYVIPRMQLGNIQLLPQPLRGARRDLESDIMHDKKHPVHHGYRAVYYSLVHQDAVDAIVHFGTHGTQEWLSGKERGQWVGDDTQTTIGNIPVVSPYTVANSGEGLIAKRRGRAVIISHNTPAFAPAGLYGELVKVNEIMLQLENMEQGRVYENTQKQLVSVVMESGFNKDLELSEKQIWEDWQGFIDALHTYLEGVASAAQPLGMHTFGSVAKDEHVLLTIMQILGPEYLQAVDSELGKDVFVQDYQELKKSLAFLSLRDFLIENKPVEVFDEKVQAYLFDAKKHWDNFQSEREIEHFLKALDAKFIPTGTGNDPLRNPEAVPTGKNTYAFDPTKIPTKAAWEAGQELAKSLIDNYREQHGIYPDKITFSMWSTETIKHFGVIEAEVFYLLGVRPVWNKRDQVVDVDIIPARELGRPRIDVVLSLTGLYRDNLPQVMSLLQNAIGKVSALKEANNHVYENSEALKNTLIEKGISEQEAMQYAQVRLFGNQSGVYGTDLPEATLASDTWDQESSLAEPYLTRMGYMFGNDELTRNARLDAVDLFAENIKGTDAAVLSRSSNNHGILSLDHPFEYLGGISLAVRHLDGKSPELFIADLRNARNFANETVPRFLARELRSRYYHPRWITEMQAEGYSGAIEMLDMINNFWGWNVMDRSAVRSDQWQELFDIYVEDKLDLKLREFFEQQHPAALAQISERMLEAVRKNYWDAPEDVIKKLLATYSELVAQYDIDTTNETFKDYVDDLARGYGMAVPQYRSQQLAEAFTDSQQQANSEKISGQVLEKQQPTASEEVQQWWLSLFGLIILAGFIWEYRVYFRFKSAQPKLHSS